MNHMERWRHILEPLVLEGIASMTWEQALEQKTVLFEALDSVVVATDSQCYGERALQIWLAAGNQDEIDLLLVKAEQYAQDHSFKYLTYCGRRGWLRTNGYKEIATVGMKKIK